MPVEVRRRAQDPTDEVAMVIPVFQPLEDKALCEMAVRGVAVSEMGYALDRSDCSVRDRLTVIGIKRPVGGTIGYKRVLGDCESCGRLFRVLQGDATFCERCRYLGARREP